MNCISFDSYIKPQLFLSSVVSSIIVYLLIPTSNHNLSASMVHRHCIVYLLIPTSNHNWLQVGKLQVLIVYLLIPTSNHNSYTKTYVFI